MSFTFVVGCEAEHIVVVLLLVSQAVVSYARHCVLAPARFSRGGDGILHGAITQPASIAPVQLSLPCIIQLIERRHDGILFSTCPLSFIEVEVVATQTGEVGEDNTYTERWETDTIAELQLSHKDWTHPLGFEFSVGILTYEWKSLCVSTAVCQPGASASGFSL